MEWEWDGTWRGRVRSGRPELAVRWWWCYLVSFFPAVNSLSAERSVDGWVSSSGKMPNLVGLLASFFVEKNASSMSWPIKTGDHSTRIEKKGL